MPDNPVTRQRAAQRCMHRLQANMLAGFVALAMSWAPLAFAHTFWLVPSSPRADPGERVTFDLRIGSALPGVRTVRFPGLVDSFTLFDARGEQPIAGHENAAPVGQVRVGKPGAAIAALRTVPRTTTLSAGQFDRYVAEESLAAQLPAWHARARRPAQVTDLYSRCAKSLVFVGQSSRGFDRIVGLPFELVPQTDPLAAGVPGRATSFAVRLLLGKQPAAGYWVKARLTTGQPAMLRARTDARGVARFALPRYGLWLFESVHIAPASSMGADFESLWASLTVEVRTKP